ncbi:MAG6450 family protein [Parvimonas sp. G1641]|uniref:MAG6450 family protein n=1 Tax=Parvimonas sp. G1641 TaxID=3388846 RepID=UPI00397EBBA8
MSKKLINVKKDNSIQNVKLAKSSVKFKILLNQQLENKFGFDKLNCSNGNREFHNFLNDTLNKGLSISEVDNLFKRTRGKSESIMIEGQERELIHYGKDRKAFRIFGYYDNEYFILTKIDTNHKTHN